MTLDQLRYFVAAAKYEHLGRAARSIPISLSVVSQSIKLLEQEYGCYLFVRDNKKMRLTPQGLRLLNLGTQLLGQADQISKELGNKLPQFEGHYRIGASILLATTVITPLWSRLQSKFPKLTADVYSQPTWNVIDSILAGRLDFGLGFNPFPSSQLEYIEVYRGVSRIVVRKNHPILMASKKKQHTLLKNYPTTLHIPSDRLPGARQHPVFKKLGLSEVSTFGFDNDYAARENLVASDNWCLMLDVVADAFKNELEEVYIPDMPPFYYSIQFVRHKAKKMDATMSEFLGIIKSHWK